MTETSVPGNKPLRKYTDAERPLSQCYDCGLSYGDDGWIDAVIPNFAWEAINPTCHEGAGLLCITCIEKRLIAADLQNIPVYIASGRMRSVHDEEMKLLLAVERAAKDGAS